MPKKKKKQRRLPHNSSPWFAPRLAMLGPNVAGAGRLLAVKCWDPRCGCAPGAVTTAPLPS